MHGIAGKTTQRCVISTLLHIHYLQSFNFVDAEDFAGGVYTVNFTNTSSNSLTSASSVAEIAIVDDDVSETTESFFCVLLRQSRTSDDGVVAEDPDTISVAIEDNDRECCG